MNRFILFMWICVTLSACRKLAIDNFGNPDSQIVINSIIHPMDSIKVHLSRNGNLSADSLEKLSNLKLELYKDDVLIQVMESGNEGLYQFDVTPIAGSRYKIILPDTDPVVTATTTIPKLDNKITGKGLPDVGIDIEGNYYAGLELNLSEPLPENTFYEITLRQAKSRSYYDWENEIYVELIVFEYDQFDFPMVDPVFLAEGMGIPIFRSQNIDSYPHSIFLPYEFGNRYSGGNYSDCILELRSISEDYFLYRKSLELYERSNNINIIDEVEPVNLYSNVDNGLGHFISYVPSITDTIKF